MLFMRNMKFLRLQFLINRRVHGFLETNGELIENSSFLKLSTLTKAIGVRCLHCCSVSNNFFKFVRKPRDVEKSQNSLSHSHLKTILQTCKSVSEQQDTFYSYVNLLAEDVAMRDCARAEIEAIFSPHFPLCSLHLIGSTVSGLGLKGCDMDVSFQTNEDDQNCSVTNERVVMTKDIEEGKVPVSVFPSLNSKQKLHLLRKILKESGILGTIIPGKFPILSFNYKGLGVDLGVNNISGLHGTNFMCLCAKLDPRIAPLFRFVSYWAKNHKLCGGAMKFKSYGLFLLVLYFLQTRHPPVLPTVENMLERTEYSKNLGNWLYDMCNYTSRIDKSGNVQGIDELLREFFFFYAYFDFSYVICTRKCELVKSSHFSALEKDFELNSISIQDPLNLSWNVTSGVNWKYCRHFSKELLYACEAYQDGSRWQPSQTSSWGILNFFDSQPSFEATQKKRVTLQIPLPTGKQETKIKEKIISIFSHCLDFQCKSVDEKELMLLRLNKSATESHKCPEENSDPSCHGTLVSRFQCTTSDTWFGRSNFWSNVLTTNPSDFDLRGCTADSSKLQVDSQCNFADVEREISKKLTASREGNKKDDFTFICECRFDGRCLNVIMDPVSSDIFIPKLAIFLKDYIPKSINKIV